MTSSILGFILIYKFTTSFSKFSDSQIKKKHLNNDSKCSKEITTQTDTRRKEKKVVFNSSNIFLFLFSSAIKMFKRYLCFITLSLSLSFYYSLSVSLSHFPFPQSHSHILIISSFIISSTHHSLSLSLSFNQVHSVFLSFCCTHTLHPSFIRTLLSLLVSFCLSSKLFLTIVSRYFLLKLAFQ